MSSNNGKYQNAQGCIKKEIIKNHINYFSRDFSIHKFWLVNSETELLSEKADQQ